MSKENLLTPVGRMVQGSLYDPNTKEMDGSPLLDKNGNSRVEYFLSLAIQKGSEAHWKDTPWGQKIWSVGAAGFPNGQANAPTFAWKVKDGDSTLPNQSGKRWCDYEGFPGHWILSFKNGFAPSIHNADGTQQLVERNHVMPGDYVQVFGTVEGNKSTMQPGVYLNHSMVAFAGYGTRIIQAPDPKSVGFGGVPLPAGASAVPLSAGFNPAPTSAPPVVQPAYYPAPAVQPAAAPPPHTGILNPHAPPPPARVMLPAAQGASYEQMIGAGWTDAMLVQHGMMQA